MAESRGREREPERVWVAEPSPDLVCSVCADVFQDPVMLACGHFFCRACAMRWFNAPAKRCPTARCPASANSQPAAMPTAYAVKNMAEALRVYCRFGLREDARGEWVPDSEGCQVRLSRAEVAAHEAACEHALEACPFAGCDVQRRRRDADAHDAEAAVAHARGERDARLALEAHARGLETQIRCERDARVALEAAATSRLDALEARLLGGVPRAAGRSVAPRVVTGAARRATLRGHTNDVWCCVWSPDGATLLSCNRGPELKLWDVTTLGCIATLAGDDNLTDCSWSPDGRMIASGSMDGTVKLWSVETHQCEATLEHAGAVLSCSWSPDGRTIASMSNDTLRLWDAATCSCTSSFNTGSNQNFRCTWSPDGRMVLVSGTNGNCALWDVATRSCIAMLSGDTHKVYNCACSPDGSAIVTASSDKTLKLWLWSAAAPFRCTATLRGHTGRVLSCAWSPDGRTVASGSSDKTVRFWDVATGNCFATPPQEQPPGGPRWPSYGYVCSCSWSPDGRTLASCGHLDNAVTLWDVQHS